MPNYKQKTKSGGRPKKWTRRRKSTISQSDVVVSASAEMDNSEQVQYIFNYSSIEFVR